MPKELLAPLRAFEALRASKVYLFSPEPIEIHGCTFEGIREDFCGAEKFKKLDVILNSGGGGLDDAFKIGRMLRRHAEHLTFFVPRYAKSAATLIALGGDEIVMLEEAELGPLDTQLPDPSDPREQISALNGFKSLEAVSMFCHVYFDQTVRVVLDNATGVHDAMAVAAQIIPGVAKPLFEQVDPHRLGVLSSALDLAQRYAQELASGYGEDASSEIASALVRSFPTHEYVIDLEQAQNLGLKAREASPKEAAPLREIASTLNDVPVFGFVDNLAEIPAEDDSEETPESDHQPDKHNAHNGVD